MERLRSSYLEGDAGRTVTTEMFDAVLASRTQSPLDIDVRLRALERFLKLPEADEPGGREQAHRQHSAQGAGRSHRRGRYEPAAGSRPERQLFDHVLSMERAVNPLFARREYAQALTQLATSAR